MSIISRFAPEGLPVSLDRHQKRKNRRIEVRRKHIVSCFSCKGRCTCPPAYVVFGSRSSTPATNDISKGGYEALANQETHYIPVAILAMVFLFYIKWLARSSKVLWTLDREQMETDLPPRWPRQTIQKVGEFVTIYATSPINKTSQKPPCTFPQKDDRLES